MQEATQKKSSSRVKTLLFILAALIVVWLMANTTLVFGDDQEILSLTFSGYAEIILDVDSYSYDFGYVSQADFEAGILVSDPFTWTISEGKDDECEILISSNGMTLEGSPIAETAEQFLQWRRTYGANFSAGKVGVTSDWVRITATPTRMALATVADWGASPDGTLFGTLRFNLLAEATPVVLDVGEYEATVYLDLALT